MANYTQAVLHSNGESLTISVAADAKIMYTVLKNDGMKFFKSDDGTMEYGVTARASTFAEFTIDQTAVTLADKPNCDNYGDCPDSADTTPTTPETSETE